MTDRQTQLSKRSKVKGMVTTPVCYYDEKHVHGIQIDSTFIPITHLINHLMPHLAGSFKCVKTIHCRVKGKVTKCVMVDQSGICTSGCVSAQLSSS